MGTIIASVIFIILGFGIERLEEAYQVKKFGEVKKDTTALNVIELILTVLGIIFTVIAVTIMLFQLVFGDTTQIEMEERYDLLVQKVEVSACTESKCILDEIYNYNTAIKIGQKRNNNFMLLWLVADYTELDTIEYSTVTSENHKAHLK